MSPELTLVVVEDNERLREEMVHFLTRPYWTVLGVDCGEHLNQVLMAQRVDMLVLDANLPHEDGYSIAARLRQSHPEIGIIMLTARVRPTDRASGYRAGVDVYLTKPTQPEELIAVIENLGRRVQRQIVRQFRLDPAMSLLTDPSGRRCPLTQTEKRLLELLALGPAQGVEIDYLLFAMTGREDRPTTREALAALISRLRSKCRLVLGIDSIILADRRACYRLTIPVRIA